MNLSIDAMITFKSILVSRLAEDRINITGGLTNRGRTKRITPEERIQADIAFKAK